MDAIRKRKFIIAIATGVILFNVALIIYVLLSGANDVEVDAVKIVSAVAAYKRQLRAARQPIPATVSAHELIERHLLAPNDVKGLGLGEITISLTFDQRRLTDPIIRVHGPDGHEITVLVDGSVHDTRP